MVLQGPFEVVDARGAPVGQIARLAQTVPVPPGQVSPADLVPGLRTRGCWCSRTGRGRVWSGLWAFHPRAALAGLGPTARPADQAVAREVDLLNDLPVHDPVAGAQR